MDRLTALQVFIAVVEQGSLSAGAERLDMSRAMVTRYLAELERWMGARLLHRTTRRQSLTTAGEEALRYARQMVVLSDSLEQVSQHANSAPRGQLRVTCSYSLAQHFLIPAVSAYQAQWPEVSVDILLQDKAVNLVEERIDVALRITAELDPNLVARRLGVCRSVVCASPDYLRRQGTPLSPPALTQHNCLTYTYFGKSVWEFNGVDGPSSVAVSGNLSCNISTLLLDAAVLGSGISLQPLVSAAPFLANGQLTALLTAWEPKQLDVYAVYSTRKQMSPLLRHFLDFLYQSMADDPLWQAANGH